MEDKRETISREAGSHYLISSIRSLIDTWCSREPGDNSEDPDKEIKALETLLDVAMDERMGLEPVLLQFIKNEGLLWLADSDKYLHIVQKLLSWEASNAPLRFFPAMQRSCASWLKRTVTRGSENLVELLTEFVTSHSLDTESILRTETSSLVHLAAAVASERIVDLILAFASGCDVAVVFAPDELGRTPLHYAASNRNKGVIDMLLHWALERLDDFAYWMTSDNEGQTPLHVAASEGNGSVFQYLVNKCCQYRMECILLQPDYSGKIPLGGTDCEASPVNSAVAQYLVDTVSKSEIPVGLRQFLFDRILVEKDFREVRQEMGKLFSEKNIKRIVGGGLYVQVLDWDYIIGQTGAFQRALEEDNGGILKFLCLCQRSASTSMRFVKFPEEPRRKKRK